MEMKKKNETWYILLGDERSFWQYDSETETAHCGDRYIHISKEKFYDFFCTAKELGLKCGMI